MTLYGPGQTFSASAVLTADAGEVLDAGPLSIANGRAHTEVGIAPVQDVRPVTWRVHPHPDHPLRGDAAARDVLAGRPGAVAATEDPVQVLVLEVAARREVLRPAHGDPAQTLDPMQRRQVMPAPRDIRPVEDLALIAPLPIGVRPGRCRRGLP